MFFLWILCTYANYNFEKRMMLEIFKKILLALIHLFGIFLVKLGKQCTVTATPDRV